MGMIDVALQHFFGNDKSEKSSDSEQPGLSEKLAGAAGKGGGGVASTVGSTVGAAIGTYFGGPAGATVGGAVGGNLGGLLDKAGSTPAGPGQTIESGHVETNHSGIVDSAVSLGQSFQQLAMKGMTQRPATDGRKKTF